MALTVIIVSLLATAATVAFFVSARKHPENASGHSTEEGSASRENFGDVNDRPGSPGAEADGVPRAGSPAPGPSAESAE